MSNIFSVFSCAIMATAAFTYFRQVLKGKSTPNPATWLIWAVVAIMNATTYHTVVEGDNLKFLMTAISAFGITLIFFYSFFKGKFTKPGEVEIICLLMAFTIGIFWRTTKNDIATNLLLQAILLISFYPTIRGLWKHGAREKHLPWSLSVIAYTFLALSIITDWDKGGWVALAHPILNGVIGNGGVVFFTYKQKQHQ